MACPPPPFVAEQTPGDPVTMLNIASSGPLAERVLPVNLRESPALCRRAWPGYTGSSPQDLRRALSDPKGNLRLFVSLSEIEELMEASIAAYNATPHAGLNGRTPLEAMHYHVRGKGHLITWLPEAKRRTLCLMQRAHRCRVRGYLGQGIRPHINLFQVRYTNEVLASTGTLLGQDLRVY